MSIKFKLSACGNFVRKHVRMRISPASYYVIRGQGSLRRSRAVIESRTLTYDR